MKNNNRANACIMLLVGTLLVSPQVSANSGNCIDFDYRGPFQRGVDQEVVPGQNGLPGGYWQHASVEESSYLPCDILGDLYVCARDSVCTADEEDVITAGFTYKADRNVVVMPDSARPYPASALEVLLAFNTKGVTS